jgi:hypothetical protein
MLLCAENVAVQPMTGATHCGPTNRSRCGHQSATLAASADSTTGPWRPGGGSLREPSGRWLEPKILSRHHAAAGTAGENWPLTWGSFWDHPLCAVMNDLCVL